MKANEEMYNPIHFHQLLCRFDIFATCTLQRHHKEKYSDEVRCWESGEVMHQSIPSMTTPPPGGFSEAVKSPTPGQNFPAKARPPGQKTPFPGEYFRRSSQPFLLIGIEILEFCRNQTLKRI